MGLSENSVPLHPMAMVNDHYSYQMAIIGGIPHFQTYPYNETVLGYFFEIQMLLFGCVLDQGYLF